MRLTSNLLEIHPQILKDKLRISKFIHKHFNPTLYSNTNMKTIKTVMKLDSQISPNGYYEGSVNLYEPFRKITSEPRRFNTKQAQFKSRKDRSVHKNQPVPLAKIILDRFEETMEKDELFTDNFQMLKMRTNLVDIMDDYYSRHISKNGEKPDHLFLFKAKPTITPGRILLDLERK